MSPVFPYHRQQAVEYALTWALKRNPRYLDFSKMGGDCTNFVSQCLLAGSNRMNYTPVYGWYYIDASNRSASWTGVPFLYNFLTTNTTRGPFAAVADISRMEPGDVIQLADETGRFYHSLFVTQIDGSPGVDTIRISTHTIDSRNRPLNTYTYHDIRFLHIVGVY